LSRWLHEQLLTLLACRHWQPPREQVQLELVLAGHLQWVTPALAPYAGAAAQAVRLVQTLLQVLKQEPLA
jgi:hypothetical protein